MTRRGPVPTMRWVCGLVLLLGLAGSPGSGARADDPAPGRAPDLEELTRKAHYLDGKAARFLDQGRCDDAIPIVREAIRLREQVGGPRTLGVADVCFAWADALRAARCDPEVRALYERALAIREELAGSEAAVVSDTLRRLGTYLSETGKHDEARALLERAVEIRAKLLGPDHVEVALLLKELSAPLLWMGRYDEARARLERALAISEKALGSEDPFTGTLLNDLGGTLGYLGRHQEALALYERALRVSERKRRPGDPYTARTLGNLASELVALGRFEEARPRLERVLALFESAGEDEDTATTLNNLAVLLAELGRPEESAALYERAIALSERVHGGKDVGTASCLANLAEALVALGRYDEARPLLLRARTIRESVLGPDHPDVATTLDSIAELLHRVGDDAEVEALMRRALAIREASLGKAHPTTGISCMNLATHLRRLGRHDEALELLDRARAAEEAAWGPDHPDTLLVLSNRAQVLLEMRRYDEARAVYEGIRDVQARLLGPDHPRVASVDNALAYIAELRGRLEEAHQGYARALAAVDRLTRRQLGGLRGPQRLALVDRVRNYLAFWLQFAPKVGDTGYPAVLRYKGLVAQVEAAERALARRGGPEVRAKVLEREAAQRRAARLANDVPSRRMDPERFAAWQKSYGEAAAEDERLALALARDFAPVREALQRLDLSPSDVQRGLAEGEVLVDFLRSGSRYLAWVVPHAGEVVRVDLGAAPAIDEAARAYVETLTPEAARTLAERVVLPVARVLGPDVRRVLLAPDAALASVPFGALPVAPDGTPWIDRVLLSEVSFAQDVLPRVDASRPGTGTLLVGGVDYDTPVEGSTTVGSRRGAVWGGLRFDPIPATREEVASISARTGENSLALLGGEATEARLRAESRGRRRLHLATHGFVRTDLRSALAARPSEERWLGGAVERQLTGADPMLLAGLALAGANARRGGAEDDGILTAAEASSLDLDGCGLVVLSACDTARGREEPGQGVLGLVQGFQAAGAGTVVASLWPVDDEATGLLMGRFYEGLLRAKDPLPPAEALRDASLWLRTQRGERGRAFDDPRYWAAFVCYERRGPGP